MNEPILTPMSGEGWDDRAKTFKENQWETRQHDRGGSWWMKQAALYAAQKEKERQNEN